MPGSMLTSYRLRIFLPFAAGYFFSYLLRNANAVITPELTRDLGIGPGRLGLLTSAYLLAFACFQLPLGMLLDHFGPRRVNGSLLLVACLGCVLFARGRSLPALVLARALIGLGVSACLMAAFQALAQRFEGRHLPAVNAALLAAGGLGALTATRPLSQVVHLLGWRGFFLAAAGLGLVAAAAVWTTSEAAATRPGEGLRDQLRGLRGVLAAPAFWRFAPLTAFANGGFIALQGLWVVPWMMQVDGLGRDAAARQLVWVSLAMILGFLAISGLASRLARAGVSPLALYRYGMGFGIVLMVLVVGRVLPSTALWMALGFAFSFSNLPFALLSASFPLHLAGRVNTVLNLAVVLGAFLLQWAIGLAVDGLTGAGLAPVAAYRATFALLTALQAGSYAWFLWSAWGGEDGGREMCRSGEAMQG
jgi:predicted MFS family arabinose efflux permease